VFGGCNSLSAGALRVVYNFVPVEIAVKVAVA